MIMPGVKIGERCVIGGGSVVTKSVPDGCMVAGNPAKYIGKTDDFYKRLKEKYDTGTGGMPADEKKRILLSLPDDKFEDKPFVTIR
jgi:serine acetyltransferase